jgi:hypothetical protein
VNLGRDRGLEQIVLRTAAEQDRHRRGSMPSPRRSSGVSGCGSGRGVVVRVNEKLDWWPASQESVEVVIVVLGRELIEVIGARHAVVGVLASAADAEQADPGITEPIEDAVLGDTEAIEAVAPLELLLHLAVGQRVSDDLVDLVP